MGNKGIKNNSLNQSLKKTKGGSIFLLPAKKVVLDFFLYFCINTVLIYTLLFFIPDASVAVIGTFFVGIIAWRGGVFAGFIGTIVMLLSNTISINIKPHNTIEQASYFDGRMPAFVMGFVQCIISGLIIGYISTLVHKLRDEITLREKVQLELEQKIAELNVFGRTVAHDLENPLGVINGSIGALLKEFSESNNEKVKKRLVFIRDSTKHMINIIKSILILAGIKKIDKNQYGMFSMSTCIKDALERMAYNIETNDVHLLKANNWPSIHGYAPWITEVWVNYVNNAIKYGHNSTKNNQRIVELGFDQPGTFSQSHNGHYRFWVKDNGKGIEKEKIDVLFKEFARLHSTKYEGHGLGLSIVKNVVEKCGGTVGVESEIGEGSLFFFTLPAQTASES